MRSFWVKLHPNPPDFTPRVYIKAVFGFLSDKLLGLINFSLVARWYVTPWLDSLPREKALTPLLLLHSFRYLGLMFLIPGVVAADISANFAVPAAYGDFLAAVLALLALIALRQQWAIAIGLIWIFNIVGTLDLLNALFQRVRHVPTGELGSAYWLPTLIVPGLLVSHYIIFRMLAKPKEGYYEPNLAAHAKEPVQSG